MNAIYAILWILFCAAEWYHLENPFYNASSKCTFYNTMLFFNQSNQETFFCKAKKKLNDLFYWEQQQIKVYCKYIVVVAGGGRAVVGGLTILFTRKRSGYRHLRPFSSRVSCFERILSGFWHASSANDGGIVLKIRQKSASYLI